MTMLSRQPEQRPTAASAGSWTSAGSPARVLVADDCPIVRQLVVMLLDTCPGLLLVGQADSGAAAVVQCGSLQPDLLVLDYDLGDVTAGEVVARIALLPERPRVLLHSARPDVSDLAARLGCAAGLAKADTVSLLAATLLDLSASSTSR